MTDSMYQANEFALIAGVTVRTLHHYDRIGLLKPSGYTNTGYRLYRKHDLVRLQQIVTLKFIGFSLSEIKRLLNSNSFDLRLALNQQRDILAEKRRQLDQAVRAIEKAHALLETESEPDWQAFKRIIEVINMQNNMDWTKKYYSEEAQEKIAERAQSIPHGGHSFLWQIKMRYDETKNWNSGLQQRCEARGHKLFTPKDQTVIKTKR